jgi:hypothetical protein
MTAIAVQADTTQRRFGLTSLRCTTGSTGTNAIYPTEPVTVVAAKQYTFSAYVKTSGVLDGSVVLRVAAAGTLTPVLAESTATSDSSDYVYGWQRIILTLTIPDGVLSVRPYVQYDPGAAGEVFWLDGLLFEPGNIASVWQGPIVSPRVVVDQAGVAVDGSSGGVLRLKTGDGNDISLGTLGLLYGDVEMYPSAAGEATIDGSLVVTGDLDITGAITAGSGLGSSSSGIMQLMTRLFVR